MVLLLSYKWFRSLPSLVRFSRIPNEIVIIKQMNAVCWRIIIDVPFPLLDNEGGGQRPRVSWCITVAILIINTIMLSSGTRPLPPPRLWKFHDNYSVRRYIAKYQESDYVVCKCAPWRVFVQPRMLGSEQQRNRGENWFRVFFKG